MSLRSLAIDIAWRAHAGQTRRDGKTPYVHHVRDVAERVERAGLGVEAIVVAWLHDVIEDSDWTGTALRDAGIPEYLVYDVQDLTRTGDVSYDDYITNLKYGATDRARHVKVHDMLSNLASEPTPFQIKRYSQSLAKLTFDYGDSE